MAIVTFKETLPIFDPEFGSLYLVAEGEADVADSHETDEARVISRASTTISATISEFVTNAFSDPSVTYQAVCDQQSNLEMQIGSVLQSREFTCYGVKLTSFGPDADSMEHINRIGKLKEAAAMTPEEIAKRIEEAERMAAAAVATMTPEELAAAEASFQKAMDETMAEQQRIIEAAQKMIAESSATAAAQADTMENAIVDAIADAVQAPKFCPNCGAPYKGGSFCGSCGTKLI